ncbi:hypothetical protein LCGC14_2181650, partial [marine sediment metagenome]
SGQDDMGGNGSEESGSSHGSSHDETGGQNPSSSDPDSGKEVAEKPLKPEKPVQMLTCDICGKEVNGKLALAGHKRSHK